MKYLDEYRDRRAAEKLLTMIRETATRPWVLMEVCGGQTHGLLRYGIDEALKGTVELVHGPGCPVCVTPLAAIDLAIDLAQRPGLLVTSFGDMLRVPGSRGSLLDARGRGGNVRVVYSPLDAVELARRHPDQEVIFFAVGFETTAPATALAVLQAEREGLQNFCLLVAHVRVQPAMERLLDEPGHPIQAFLAAGHVCTITGVESYERLVEKHQVPVVVTGFEPLDLLDGILAGVRQLESGRAEVENRYARSVRARGNPQARELVETVYQVGDRPWRGLGTIIDGGLHLRESYERFDAERKFDSASRLPVLESEICRSGEVMAGKIKPPECEAFGQTCRPENPLGAPMVSSEGACAAYYQFHSAKPQLSHGS